MTKFRRTKHDVPERIDPLTEPPGIVAHHLAKYDFARSNSAAGRCLDVGCGVGYGSAYLAAFGHQVSAVDVNEHAVRLGASRYSSDGVTFGVMDASRLAFGSALFQTVTCFEVIEHLVDPSAHVREASRVLEPTGGYFVSTPRPGTGGDPATNPFHQREFSKNDLLDLLSEYFKEVTLFGQRKLRTKTEEALRKVDPLGIRRIGWLRPFVKRLGGALGLRPTEDTRIQDFVIDPEGADTGSDFVAVCRGPQ